MKIELDERKVRYFQEVVAPVMEASLEQVINNLFRSYLEQVGVTGRVEISYAAWLERRLEEELKTGR